MWITPGIEFTPPSNFRIINEKYFLNEFIHVPAERGEKVRVKATAFTRYLPRLVRAAIRSAQQPPHEQ